MTKRLHESRKHDLVALAEEVVNHHSPTAGATDLLRIAEENDISIHFDQYGEEFDGVLEFANARFHIHVNLTRSGKHDSERARFTISHELGHFFIDEHRQALMGGEAPHGSNCGLFDSADSTEELEADLFAANLLMPPSRFLAALRVRETPLTAIKRLATTFRSSITATAIHYASIGANRCAIIRWNPDGSYGWPRIGKGYFADGFRRPLYAEGVEPLKDSATGIVVAGIESEADAVSTTATMFSNVASGQSRDHLLREEALALGKYGFMTFLSALEM